MSGMIIIIKTESKKTKDKKIEEVIFMAQTNSNQSFIQYLRANPTTNGVTPFPVPVAIGIAVVLTLIDTVGCVVLLIAGYVFVKKGHQGMAMLLAITNLVIPDALPVVDEAIQIVIVVVPVYRGYKKVQAGQANIADVALDVINSTQTYYNNAESYMNMDGTDIIRTVAEEYATNSENNNNVQSPQNNEIPVQSMKNNKQRKI